MASELEKRQKVLATQAEELKRAQQALMENVNAVRAVASDLQDALYLLRDYQNVIRRLYAPDPNIGPANALLKRYQIEPGKRSPFFTVLLDGLDITDPTELAIIESIFEHPIFDADSTATEEAGDLPAGNVGELPSGDA